MDRKEQFKAYLDGDKTREDAIEQLKILIKLYEEVNELSNHLHWMKRCLTDGWRKVSNEGCPVRIGDYLLELDGSSGNERVIITKKEIVSIKEYGDDSN